jgi:hypothetical protein
MRTLTLIAVAPVLLSGLARAQVPNDSHLLSEPDEYVAAQNASQPYWVPPPQGQPQGQFVGDGKPYAGQPQYTYGQQPTWADENQDEEEGDDQYADDAGLDEGWDAEAYTDFESALSPYGSWIDTPEYGRVWIPSADEVGDDFQPYATNGNWDLTDYGWTWASDYSWGWAPFHYGRWLPIGGYGWCWRPGRTWGPAWVAWRFGGGYVGWHPLPPRGVHIAPPLNGHTTWRFTTATQFGATHPGYLPARTVGQIWNHTQPVVNLHAYNGAHINLGPHPQVMAAAAGHAFVATPVRSLSVAAPHASIVPRVTPANNRMPAPAPHPYAAPIAPYRAPVTLRPGNQRYGYQVSPSYRGQLPAPSYNVAPSYYHYQAPSYAAPHYSAPSYYSSPHYSAPHYSAPSFAPRYSAPSYSAPHYNYSAPSYSAPHYSAPSYSAPHYTAPSYHSTPSYSAPAPHFSGGGRFGGGHFGGHR